MMRGRGNSKKALIANNAPLFGWNQVGYQALGGAMTDMDETIEKIMMANRAV
jgi:hypothetical protein